MATERSQTAKQTDFIVECSLKERDRSIPRLAVLGDQHDAEVAAQQLQHGAQERGGDRRISLGHWTCGLPNRTYGISWPSKKCLVRRGHHHVANGGIADCRGGATEHFSTSH